jgi:hypothetical protein
MLKKMPKLETLTLDRCHFIWNCSGPALTMATAQDVCRIRKMFLRLENISLDLAIHGVTGRWPYDILEELALFEELIELDLFLHPIDSKIARLWFIASPSERSFVTLLHYVDPSNFPVSCSSRLASGSCNCGKNSETNPTTRIGTYGWMNTEKRIGHGITLRTARMKLCM